MQDSFRDNASTIFWSVTGHALVFLLVTLNLSVMPDLSSQPVRLAIEATVVPDRPDTRQPEAEQARLEAERRKADKERQRLAEEQRKIEAEKQKEAEQAREAEEQRQKEIEATREAEQQKQEQERIALEKRQQEEAEQQRKAEEQKREQERIALEKRQQEEAEQQRKAEEQKREQERIAAEQRRKDEEARLQAEMDAEMQAQLAEEEQRQSAVRSGLLDQWVEVIRQRVQRNWNRPASAQPGLECEVRVSQIPGGEVVDVRLGDCNGDAAVVRSIENAVYRSSPLPPPNDPSLFERTLIFTFKPQE